MRGHRVGISEDLAREYNVKLDRWAIELHRGIKRMIVKPVIVVLIPREWSLGTWTRVSANEAIRRALDRDFPNEDIRIAAWEVSPDNPITIALQHDVGTGSELPFAYEEVSQEHLNAVGNVVVGQLIDHERRAIADFRTRLKRCETVLSEYRRRPQILSEFMADIADLYGLVVETDMAMLMASDHFGRIAKNSPDSQQIFSRRRVPTTGSLGIPYQYSRTAKQVVDHYALTGRNRILRNRFVILFMYELWERRYRSGVATACGKAKDDIQSDIFGDLRIYRNSIAHKGAVLDTKPKVLTFVELGKPIDLVLVMDDLIEAVVAELNRLAAVYFEVATRFTLDNVAGGVVVAQGPSWQSDHTVVVS